MTLEEMWISLSAGDGATPAEWVPEAAVDAWAEMLRSRTMDACIKADRACRAVNKTCFHGDGSPWNPISCHDTRGAYISNEAWQSASAAFTALRSVNDDKIGFCADKGYSESYADASIWHAKRAAAA